MLLAIKDWRGAEFHRWANRRGMPGGGFLAGIRLTRELRQRHGVRRAATLGAEPWSTLQPDHFSGGSTAAGHERKLEQDRGRRLFQGTIERLALKRMLDRAIHRTRREIGRPQGGPGDRPKSSAEGPTASRP